MSNAQKKPARPWRIVADEMSHANRGDQILELAEELEQAFQEQASDPHKPATAVQQNVASASRIEQKNTRSG